MLIKKNLAFKKNPGLAVGIKGLGSVARNPLGVIGNAQSKFGFMQKIPEKTNESQNGDSDDVIAVKGNVSEDNEDQESCMGRYVNLEVHFRNSFKLMTCGRRWTPEEIIKFVSKELKVSQRDIDSFDHSSLILSLVDENGKSTTIDDLRNLDEGSKVLIEVHSWVIKQSILKAGSIQSKSSATVSLFDEPSMQSPSIDKSSISSGQKQSKQLSISRFTATNMQKHSPLELETTGAIFKHTIGQRIFSDDPDIVKAPISRSRANFSDGKQSEPISAVDRPLNCVTEMDFLQLKYFLKLASKDDGSAQMDYHNLVRMINQSWSSRLNFQVKLTRPPKWNRDETICTMKLYCTKFSGKKKHESCQFGLTIKYDNYNWICTDSYQVENMCHIGHSIDMGQNSIQGVVLTNRGEEDPNTEEMIENDHNQVYSQIIPQAQSNEEATKKRAATSLEGDISLGLFGYLENYRKLLGQMQQLDSIVQKQGKTLDLSNGTSSSRIRRVQSSVQRITQNVDQSVKKQKSHQGADGKLQTKNVSSRHVREYAAFIQQLRIMQHQEEQTNRYCYLSVQEQVEKSGVFDNLFFCSYSMRENYLNYRDVVFINKWFVKTRFSKVLLLFCGISNQGKSILFAFAFLNKEDEESFEYASEHFGKALATSDPPKIVIIERNALVKSSVQKLFQQNNKNNIPVLYCYNHYQKCIRIFFDMAKDSQAKHFSTANEMLDTLPVIANTRIFEQRISKLDRKRAKYVNNNEKLSQIIEKIYSERHLWAKVYHLVHFTAGVDFCARNEAIKSFLYQLLMNKNGPIEEIAKCLSKSDCFQSIECHNPINEFKKVKLGRLEELPVFDKYLPSNLTKYAVCRVWYTAAKAFKYFHITKQDKMSKTFLVERKIQCEDPEEIRQEPQKYHKVKVIEDRVFCTCMAYFNSGLPCEHQLLVAVQHRIKFLIHSRWNQNYEQILNEMKDSSRNERVFMIADQLEFERKTVFDAFNKVSMPLGLPTPKKTWPQTNEDGLIQSSEESDDEDNHEIKKLQIALTTQIYKEDVRIILQDQLKQTPQKVNSGPSTNNVLVKKPNMFGGGNFSRNKFAPKPVNAPQTSGAIQDKPSAPFKIGQNQLIELKEHFAEMMIKPLDQEQANDENALVQILPLEKNQVQDEFKLPNEYGFKEKMKAAKLRGGKPAKEPKAKKEKKVINLGGDNIAGKEKKAKPKKQKQGKVEEEVQEELVQVKKEVSKVSLDSLLQVKSAGADGTMSMAERMAKMRKQQEEVKTDKKTKSETKTDKPKREKKPSKEKQGTIKATKKDELKQKKRDLKQKEKGEQKNKSESGKEGEKEKKKTKKSKKSKKKNEEKGGSQSKKRRREKVDQKDSVEEPEKKRRRSDRNKPKSSSIDTEQFLKQAQAANEANIGQSQLIKDPSNEGTSAIKEDQNMIEDTEVE